MVFRTFRKDRGSVDDVCCHPLSPSSAACVPTDVALLNRRRTVAGRTLFVLSGFQKLGLQTAYFLSQLMASGESLPLDGSWSASFASSGALVLAYSVTKQVATLPFMSPVLSMLGFT